MVFLFSANHPILYSSDKSYRRNMNPSRAYLPVMVQIHLGTGSGGLVGKVALALALAVLLVCELLHHSSCFLCSKLSANYHSLLAATAPPLLPVVAAADLTPLRCRCRCLSMLSWPPTM